jgi:ABC-type uncharacterized transport system auxiliary subunit
MSRTGRLAAALLLATALTGCVRLSQRAPQIRNYSLAYPPPHISGTPLPLVLGISPLRAAATYDRDFIVYREGEYTIGTYSYSRWSANPASMIADLLARDFADSGLYRAVERRTGLLPIDYQLTGDIEEIEERVAANGDCSAHLRMRLLLLRARSGAQPVSLRKAYAGDEPCKCDADALAAAMSRILERLSSELQRDVQDAIAQDGREHRSGSG